MHQQIPFQTATNEHVDSISSVIRDAFGRVNAKDYPPAEIDRLLQAFSRDGALELMKKGRLGWPCQMK